MRAEVLSRYVESELEQFDPDWDHCTAFEAQAGP